MCIRTELQAVVEKLSLQESRPTCGHCGRGRLVLIDERPHPIFGVLGLLEQILKCNLPGCGKSTRA